MTLSAPVSDVSGGRMGGSLLALLAALALAAGIAGLAPAPTQAADLFLSGEREIYLAVDKLNAMGRLPGFLANTRPYSVAAVRAALAGNAAASQGIGFDAQLAQWVSFATKPTLLVRGTAGLEADEKRETRANEGGIPTPKGVSGRLSILAREEATPFVSAHASAAAFFGEAGDDGTRVGETAIETGIPYAALQIGKITTWYGPGRLGALLFTNNAQSYPGIRLHNPVPIAVPGLFSFLGNVQYDLFLARLESDRPIPSPLLFGMRLAARPSRFLELGVSRASQFGGEGRPENLSTFLHILKGQRESAGNTPVGNSLASVDAIVVLPFAAQPVSLYFEWGGEDQSQPFIFTRHAWLGGVFLPSIGPFQNADLRIEYGTTLTSAPGVWYRHGEYPHLYRGRILGHPMGTDAKDLSIQGHYFFLPSTYLELTLSRTDRLFPGPDRERTDRASAGLVGWFSERVRVETELALEKVKNPAGLPDSPAEDASFRVALSYQLGSGQ
jgi:hypothetical protein